MPFLVERPVSPEDRLYKALNGSKCDISAVINILACQDATQRACIQYEYREKYSKELSEELSKRLASKLWPSGNLKSAVLLWLPDPAERDATIVKQAINAGGKLEAATEIICSCTPSRLHGLKKLYHSKFSVDLEREIELNTTGDHRKILIAYISTPRPEDPEPATEEMAKKDAEILYNAGEKKLGTDEKNFFGIFSERSGAQLALVSSCYHDMYGHSLKKAVKNQASGNFCHALLTIIQCATNPGKYFAKVLYKAMKGWVTNDTTLIRVIVTRTEIDMECIKAEYSKKYGKTLDGAIDSATSGHYRDFLLAVLCSNH